MAEGDVTFGVTASTDGEAVRLETFVDGESASWVDLDASGLDWLIASLATARAALIEQAPATFEPTGNLAVVDDPSWWVGDPDPGGQTLALRHPGLGWLGFFLPQDQAAEIAGWLKKPYQP